ncbi:hypothetical protein [Neosynechococcus sphagnicola]|uniref:hypothetical protein n=1 Tax=Neosynechococcus sphagnicola TaxID=1501145 RepID=UPI00068B5AB3|nr:hypothetical protein [Neosynechococcus sphagnicola]
MPYPVPPPEPAAIVQVPQQGRSLAAIPEPTVTLPQVVQPVSASTPVLTTDEFSTAHPAQRAHLLGPAIAIDPLDPTASASENLEPEAPPLENFRTTDAATTDQLAAAFTAHDSIGSIPEPHLTLTDAASTQALTVALATSTTPSQTLVTIPELAAVAREQAQLNSFADRGELIGQRFPSPIATPPTPPTLRRSKIAPAPTPPVPDPFPYQPPGTLGVVELTADHQEYDNERQMFTAAGNVVMRFQGQVLDADRLQVNLNNRRAVAEGNVAFNPKLPDPAR